MIRTRIATRALSSMTVAAAAALLAVACKQPAPAVVDAGPPTPPPAASSAAPAVLTPMDEDAGSAVDAAPAVHHAGGPGQTTNQIRAKQCCAALKSQAGSDPSLAAIVGMCNAVAAQLGPSSQGEAPEFAAVRAMLKGHNIPAICQGL
jgi:hypothetical protein